MPAGVPDVVVKESVDAKAAGFGAKSALAPAGNPLTLRATGPVKPPLGVIVKVYVVPGAMLIPVALHAYCVPDAVWVTTGATNTPGWLVAALTTTGETVSVTDSPVIVAVPVLATTIR